MDNSDEINPAGLDPGKVYIIDIGRKGKHYTDMKRLRRIFRKLDMPVDHVWMGSVDEVKVAMHDVSSYDFHNLSCLIIFLITCCCENKLLYAKDGRFSYERDIMSPIRRNNSLKGKPKLLFIHGCYKEGNPFTIENSEEYFQVHSYSEECWFGFFEYEESGTVYFDTLCSKLEQSAFNECIQDIVAEVASDCKRKCAKSETFQNESVEIKAKLPHPFVLGHYVKNRTALQKDWERRLMTPPFWDPIDFLNDKIQGFKSMKPISREDLLPGRAYIINHQTFNDKNYKPRPGSKIDIKKLQLVFRKLGLNVQTIHDGTLPDVRSMMKIVSTYDFTTLSCLVLVIMSHGERLNKIVTKDGEYSIDHEIMRPILANKTLVSKAKIIFVESCKGPVNPRNDEIETESASSDSIIRLDNSREVRERPTAVPDEVFQLNSSVEGFVSYINPKGSRFIQSLCKHLDQSGVKKTIEEIAKDVLIDVKGYDGYQIPMMHTNLTQRFVFGDFRKVVRRRRSF